jgi:hypothetical protein
MHFYCNLDIGFVTKCKVQGPMSVFRCETLSQMGENVRDEAQWFPNVLPLWELHLCGSCECSEAWLERQTNTKLGS